MEAAFEIEAECARRHVGFAMTVDPVDGGGLVFYANVEFFDGTWRQFEVTTPTRLNLADPAWEEHFIRLLAPDAEITCATIH